MNKLFMVIKKYRVTEVILMTGLCMIGFFIGLDSISFQKTVKTFIVFTTVYFLFQSVYFLNSFWGAKNDCKNKRLISFLKNDLNRLLLLTIVTLLISLSFSWYLGKDIFILSFICFFIWSFYSLPYYGGKERPVIGTFCHFIAQIIHFHIGYLCTSQVSISSISISIYFALIFSAGHLWHEIIDYEADKMSCISTNAVFFGIKKTINAFFIINTISLVYLLYISIAGYLTSLTFYSLLGAGTVQLTIGLFFITKSNIMLKRIQYRSIYRISYLISCMIIVGSKC